MFNLNCQLINFICHLKQRGGVDMTGRRTLEVSAAVWLLCCLDINSPPPDSVDLMDTSGRLMNLQEKQDSMEPAGGVLVERRHYILLRVRRESPARRMMCFYCEGARQSFCLLQGETEQQQQRHSTFLWWTARARATLSSQVAPDPPD